MGTPTRRCVCTLRFDLDRVPRLENVNAFMARLTGVRAQAVARATYRIEWVVNQGFDVHSMQPLPFIIDSFEHLVDEVGRLELSVREGRLDHVGGGEPAVSQEDLDSFVAAVVAAP